MARIDREILVPYLRDVCALELAKKQYQERIADLNQEVADAKNAIRNQPEAKKVYSYYDGKLLRGISKFGVHWFEGAVVGFIILAILEKLGATWADNGVIDVCGKVLVIGLVVGPILAIAAFLLRMILSGVMKIGAYGGTLRNQHKWRKQKRELKSNEQTCEYFAEAEIQKLDQEISVIQNLLNQAYAANLIPGRYRGLYSAVYLYDWFSTSMSDDMDMALNTFVLEQIKSRLDEIIQNQTKQLINQRRMMAKQDMMNRTIEREAERMRDNVYKMNESMEKQNMYLNMIDSNMAATRYFAEEAYKKWY